MGAADDIYGGKPKPGTTLSEDGERGYQQWKATMPKRLQSEGDYDLRGFYRENPNFSLDTPGQHMTDKFKLPNHDTFSNESQYFNDETKKYAGHWSPNPSDKGWSYLPYDPAVKSRIVEDPNGERVPVPQVQDPERTKAALLMSHLYGMPR